MNDGSGARRAGPTAKAEGPLWVDGGRWFQGREGPAQTVETRSLLGTVDVCAGLACDAVSKLCTGRPEMFERTNRRKSERQVPLRASFMALLGGVGDYGLAGIEAEIASHGRLRRG